MLTWDAEAIVLSTADSRDDKIVRLLLESDEVVPALVRFARRGIKKASRAAKLQPLSVVHVSLRGKPADELATLEAVSAETPHAIVKADLVRLALASTMAEIVLQLVPDWGREEGVYALLSRALGRLGDAQAKASEALLALFELRMLDLGGVLPPLETIEELPASSRAGLEAWRQGRFVALPEREVRAICRVLERALLAASGRPLASRAFLEQMLVL